MDEQGGDENETRAELRCFARVTFPGFNIRLADAEGRLVPDRALGRVRRVEKSRGCFLISIEFSHPLESINFP